MYPKNLITRLPNLMMLPRPTDLYFSDKDQGFVYSMIGGGGSDGGGDGDGGVEYLKPLPRCDLHMFPTDSDDDGAGDAFGSGVPL